MNPIKTALLSFGMSGKIFHAPFIKVNKSFQLAGAWERTKKEIQTIYPGTVSYNTLEDILTDPTIKLVVVNTPNITHFDFAKKSLEAGKHVVVEKAFTTTVKEAEELKLIAAVVGKKISVYQSRRWDSDFKTVQKLLQQNLLGEIVDAEIRFERFRPLLSAKQHKELPQPGAGLLNDLGPHLIDQALCLFGMPSHIYATLLKTRPSSQVDDWFDILLYYPTKTVRLKFSYFAKEPLPGYIVNGTRGSFIKSRADVQESLLLAGLQPLAANWGTEPAGEEGILHYEKNGIVVKEKIASEKGSYGDFYTLLHLAIREDKAVPVSCDEAIHVMQLIELAVESNLLGKKMTVEKR